MTSVAGQPARSWWLKTLYRWHWISSAIALLGLLAFAATGITLNHAAQIEARPVVVERKATLPPALLAAQAPRPGETRRHDAPLPPALAAWVAGALCLWVLLNQRRKAAAEVARARSFAGAGDAQARPLLIVHASQTGAAEQLAWQTAQALRDAALPAPDSAAPFVRRFMGEAAVASLRGVQHGVLALGDREFADFCAFGRRLDAWLLQAGACPLFDRIDVDGIAPDALARWRHELGRLASVGESLAWAEPARETWRLAARRQVNAGSSGTPVFHLELEPPAGAARRWEPGDLLQVRVPRAPEQPRAYSIASIPAEGRAHLLVRQQRRSDGRPGLASGWLTQQVQVGGAVVLKLLPHRNFRLGDNAGRPLILVGNGTGIAGLGAHLNARASRGLRNWLVFGERQAAHDFHFRSDIEAWLADGTLTRLDLAFSRDPGAKAYVQDRLRVASAAVREWLDDGAAIYVCGSLQGMATGVEEALVEILGRARLDVLIDEGRYRRDVY
jgi:sulfite reductase (NADPH) flavoprotein alpha-component